MSNGANGFPKSQQPVQVMKQVVGQVPPNNHVQTPIAQVVENKMVPIQITLPAQPGSDGGQRVLTIQVPASALQGNQLHKVLTGPVITATMSLPQSLASSVLQQHVNAALSSQQQAVTIGSIVNKSVIQSDGCVDSSTSEDELLGSNSAVENNNTKQKFQFTRHKRLCKMVQADGTQDTSDEDDDASEDEDGSDEGDDDKDEDEQEMDEGGPEEEPLNSEDDVTDDDPTDLFDTENVVVCQYDKVLILICLPIFLLFHMLFI